MRIRIIKIIIVITVIFGVMAFAVRKTDAVIKRAGSIELVADEPLFTGSAVWQPGLTIEKSFQVKNRGAGGKTLRIWSENESETQSLSRILQFQVRGEGRVIYGADETKTLADFFDEQPINLGEIFAGDTGKTFSLMVTMPASVGNQYQAGWAEFDLRLGFEGDESSEVMISALAVSSPAPTDLPVLGISSAVEGAAGGKEAIYPAGDEIPANEPEETAKGEVAGTKTGGVGWRLLAIAGGLVVSAGAAAWLMLRRE